MGGETYGCNRSLFVRLSQGEIYGDVLDVVQGGTEVEYNCNFANTGLMMDESFEVRYPDEDSRSREGYQVLTRRYVSYGNKGWSNVGNRRAEHTCFEVAVG